MTKEYRTQNVSLGGFMEAGSDLQLLLDKTPTGFGYGEGVRLGKVS